jgi:rubredoxin
MPQIPSTPGHCPGFDEFKNLKSFVCKCPECGTEKEIFSDEFNRPHTCKGCNKPIDFTQCSLEGEAKSTRPE